MCLRLCGQSETIKKGGRSVGEPTGAQCALVPSVATCSWIRSGGGVRGTEDDGAGGVARGVHDVRVHGGSLLLVDVARADDQADGQGGAGQDEVRGPQPVAEVSPGVPVVAADVVRVLRELRGKGAEHTGAEQVDGHEHELALRGEGLAPGDHAGDDQQAEGQRADEDRGGDPRETGDR